MSAALVETAACVFDAYGTLFDLTAIDRNSRQALGDNADRLLDLWRRKQLEYSWLRSLMGRHADFWEVTGESLDYAMAALGIDDPMLRSGLMERFLAPRPYPEAVDVLTRLRQAGLKLAILSNGSPLMLTSACAASGLQGLFDAVLSVESAGVYKPHPGVYRLACERLAVPAEAIAFLSANGWDAAGAAAFGFRVAWVNRAGAPRERLPAAPHYEIPDLAGLPPLLGL